MNPRIIPACLLFFSSSLSTRGEEARSVTVEDLNSRVAVVGALGKPVFKVRKVTGLFVKGATGPRGGDTWLEVTHVDEAKLPKPVRTDFSGWDFTITLPSGEDIAYSDDQARADLVGKSITCLGYEDVQTEGHPPEMTKYVETHTDIGLKFHSVLVIVKVFPEANAKPAGDTNQSGKEVPQPAPKSDC